MFNGVIDGHREIEVRDDVITIYGVKLKRSWLQAVKNEIADLGTELSTPFVIIEYSIYDGPGSFVIQVTEDDMTFDVYVAKYKITDSEEL